VLFIIPGMLVTLILAWAYVAYGSLPEVGWVLYGVKPVVIAIILQALWDLGKKAVKGWVTAFVGIGVLAFYLLGLNEILLLFAGASVVVAVYAIRRYRWKSAAAVVGAPLVNLPVIAAGVAGFSQTTLFLSFLKIGAGLYGSGYVLVAFMRSEFVTQLGWLTNQQLLDAVAVGQATPGPVFTIATFAGYLVGS
jgi:chromate transporter